MTVAELLVELNKYDDDVEVIMVNGKKMRLAAWVKEGKNGKFFSGKMSEPLQSTFRQQENDSQGTGDLPF